MFPRRKVSSIQVLQEGGVGQGLEEARDLVALPVVVSFVPRQIERASRTRLGL